MQGSFNERRKYKRAECRINTEYFQMHFLPQALSQNKAPVKQPAKTVNISEGGIQLVADSAPDPGQIVRLVISPDDREKRINAFAKVKWANYDGNIKQFRIGVEFCYLHEAGRKRIRSLVN